MMVNPGTGTGVGGTTESPPPSKDTVARLARAYMATYHGPHGDAPGADAAITAPVDRASLGTLVSPAMVEAQYRLGRHRSFGDTRVAVYADDDPAGFGPALQIVTDNASMLMDSVTVLLHRLGVAYTAIMNPVFRARRGPSGELLAIEPAADAPFGDGIDEAWIHVQLADSVDPKAVEEVKRLLPSVLADARQVALDSTSMTAMLSSLAAELDSDTQGRFPSSDRKDVAALLRWLADGHFVLLGYQRCQVSNGQSSVDPSSRLGVLRLRTDVLPQLTSSDDLLVLAQATMPSYLRYGAHPYIVVVREQSRQAAVEHRFVGLFTVAAMNANVLEIPLISRRVNDALAMAHRDPSHPGQLLLDIIQTIPRSELFALSAKELLDMAMAVVDLGSRRRTLLFLRADQLAHFVSCLVYLPRDRYTTAVRLEMQDILVRELGGVSIDYAARVSESPWAVVHFTVRLPEGRRQQDIDVSLENESRIQDLLTEAARTWGDRLIGAVKTGSITQTMAEHYAAAFPEVYKQAVAPLDAIKDIAIIEELQDNSVKLVLGDRGADGIAQLTWYLGGRSASLSHLLPMLQSMGVVVLEERPFTVTRPDGLPVWIYQFKISPHPDIPTPPAGPDRVAMAERFADAVTAIWHGRVEIDRFNELVLRAGLTWQQVAVLRTYAKYLRQAGFPYSQSHIEGGAQRQRRHRPISGRVVRGLVRPEAVGRDPAPGRAGRRRRRRSGHRRACQPRHRSRTASLCVDDPGHAADQLLCQQAGFGACAERVVDQTQPTADRRTAVAAAQVRDLRVLAARRGRAPAVRVRRPRRPAVVGPPRRLPHRDPRPRQGAGGEERRHRPGRRQGRLRRQDAACGHRRSPRPTATRNAPRAWPATSCSLPGCLTSPTTSTRQPATSSLRRDVVRRDGDDAYLVVAADKGTATFSDIANEVAASYGFWLGDAFASGGSVGYDHKAMGITAKGAWEAVKRHFREMGVDTQTEDFTVVGVGDMSGDVFGNGMLLSKHIRLLAAFDHRHIFVDPNPDAATSWDERKRLFDLPRSSWEDYDRSLISEGGGVYSREQKSIPISPQARAALGIADGIEELTPPALIKAILKAPADLLFNGGIGTYIKAETESDADVGDRANDPVRVNGNQVRAKVIGEGGNLGVTSLGRIEFNLAGGRCNTDAMDNSAGVDCSDHEVNIKILVDSLVTAGKVGPRTGPNCWCR